MKSRIIKTEPHANGKDVFKKKKNQFVICAHTYLFAALLNAHAVHVHVAEAVERAHTAFGRRLTKQLQCGGIVLLHAHALHVQLSKNRCQKKEGGGGLIHVR